MPSFDLQVNGHSYTIEAEAQMPLLWALRDLIGLTGTKFSCGIGLCGACTVLIEGQPERSCITPLDGLAGKAITTIEGLSSGADLHPVQAAFLHHDASSAAIAPPARSCRPQR